MSDENDKLLAMTIPQMGLWIKDNLETKLEKISDNHWIMCKSINTEYAIIQYTVEVDILELESEE